MRKQETADLDELVAIVGKPTPGTRYTPMKNPAITALLEHYHLDLNEVTGKYEGLVTLGWIEPNVGKFVQLVNRYADKMQKKLDRLSRKGSYTRPADSEMPDGPVDDPYYDEEEDAGALTLIKRKLRKANAEKRLAEAEKYLYRKLIEGTAEAMQALKPAKFNITYSRPTARYGGDTKFYNILPISDVHWGEVIVPDHINCGNEYNFEVSKRRHIELFRKNHEFAKMYGCDEVNIFMLGDILAGNIHDELRESAETTVCDAMAQYLQFITGLISSYAAEFKRIDIFCVVGNHARVTKEIRFKKKGIDNYEYTLYRMMETYFNALPKLNVHVHVDEATVMFANVGAQTWKLEHGDSYRGGTAFAAPYPSLTRDGFKDRMMYAGMGYEYQASMIGHFHVGGEHFIQGDSAPIYINPSIVGPGEYSLKTCHSAYPASSYLFITDGNEVVDRKFVNLMKA